MARPEYLTTASDVANGKFAEAADPAPEAPPSTPPLDSGPDGAPPVLALEDILPTIAPAAPAGEILDDLNGPDFLSEIFGEVI